MFPNRSDASTTERTRSRWFTTVAILLATVVITAGTTAAAAAQAAEHTERVAEARTAAIGEVAHRVGVGAGGIDVSQARLSSAVELVTEEIALADAALTRSSGKATDATRTALQTATDAARVTSSATDVDAVLDAVYGLRELEKKTTEEVAAWQKAEDARIAAEAAAAAAAAAAAQAAADAAAQAAASESASWSDESTDDSWSEPAAAEPAAAEPAAAAPAGDAPANDNCGPCPGATLVPVVYDGVTYWGCP